MKVCFIGGGNMASAMIGGLLKSGLSADSVSAVDVDAGQRERLAQRFGIRTCDAAADALAGSDCVVLAVKPQQVRNVAAGLAPLLDGQLVVTIAAGIRTADLARWLGGYDRIARAMPNTPALIGQGIAGLYAGPQLPGEDRASVERILGAVGQVLWVDREALIDAVTAVSGSGPAYVFMMIEALEAAAQGVGFDAAQARQLALATFAGAANLAAGDAEPPAVLRARVTSKGGTTERGIAALEAGGLHGLVAGAVHAANVRAVELGEESGKDPR
jgi:pyrroline-5-carboxylate reductase